MREGNFDRQAIERAAPVLKLDAAALRKLAQGNWEARRADAIEGLAQFNTTYHDMTVNAYLVWDPVTREAVVFDTGADCEECCSASRGETKDETDSAYARASGSRG